MIVVTAASGALGRLVVERLSAHTEVVAAVRDPSRAPEGVAVRHGDYDDPAGLRAAFDGADRLLLISSPELDAAKRVAQHRNAISAARDAGVGAIAYTSFLGADTTATGLTEAHHATEQALRDSGVPHTLLRHPFYSDAFVPRIVDGELTASTGGRGLNTAFRADLADAAAAVLLDDAHLGKAYDLTGPLWTHPEVAEALGVTYREVPDDGPGPMRWLTAQVRAGALERQTPDLARVLGRAPRTMAGHLRATGF
ncbi:NAD(P)H-binding protein [Nocardia sp. NRRL S-836]|uniref:NAD(P)H-binding protein n=1 Tax=Nocardia sp. NRRL S-836 TaxID=1519492 RepID=UPI0006AF32AA|nr:NAD(P)H-binding protein [Nocardia sp. NRRL S-836]KOV79939.1 NmrA family transcriptional regulator [Nocardia sp. NRRL S-836]